MWEVGGIWRNHVTNPTKKCQKTESWENDKCFYSGSDRKVPTQAHQPIVLIKQLYNGSTFLLSKYSEVNHHPSLSLSLFLERERGNITLDDKMGHFLSQVVRTMNLSVQPIDLSAWPKWSTKLLPMHRSIWISWWCDGIALGQIGLSWRPAKPNCGE